MFLAKQSHIFWNSEQKKIHVEAEVVWEGTPLLGSTEEKKAWVILRVKNKHLEKQNKLEEAFAWASAIF